MYYTRLLPDRRLLMLSLSSEVGTDRNEAFLPLPMIFLFFTTTAPSLYTMLDSLATSAHAAKNVA